MYSFRLERSIKKSEFSTCFSTKDNLLAYESSRYIIVEELDSGKEISRCGYDESYGYAVNLFFLNDTRYILVQFCDVSAIVFNWIEKTHSILQGHDRRITFVNECSNGTVVTCSLDKTIRLWSASDGQCLCVLSLSENVPLCVSYHSGTNRILVGDDGGYITSFDMNTFSLVHSRKTHNEMVLEIMPFIQGLYLSTGRLYSDESWNPETLESVNIIQRRLKMPKFTFTSDESQGVDIEHVGRGVYIRTFGFSNPGVDTSVAPLDLGWIYFPTISSCGNFLIALDARSIEVLRVSPPFPSIVHSEDVQIDGVDRKIRLFTNGRVIDEYGKELRRD